jgi:hypothetical protein
MRLIASIGFSAALTLAAVATSMPAYSLTVNINLGRGSTLNSGRPVQCADGTRLLRGRGFRTVRAVDCRGRNFVYLAWRGGAQYEVVVRARDARILTTRRLRR